MKENYLRTCFLLMSLVFGSMSLVWAQASFETLPKNYQLFPRDQLSNTALLEVKGNYNRSGTEPNLIRLRLDLFIEGESIPLESSEQELSYSAQVAAFDLSVDLPATLANHRIELTGILANDNESPLALPDGFGNFLVAGDVFIVQGQSNAEAKVRDGSTAAEAQSDFIRVYASGTEDYDDLIGNDQWFIADVDGGREDDGNTGQWGAALAKKIIDSIQIPVAIFNGAKGAKKIDFFLETYQGSDEPLAAENNYQRLKYRLDQTGLSPYVRAILWSHGENVSSSVEEYKTNFRQLEASWKNDYTGLEGIYLLQVINGCLQYVGGTDTELMYSKEALRQLAEESPDIEIINTDGLVNAADDCHFLFPAGYQEMGNRLFHLVHRDLYDGPELTYQFSPNPISAELVDDVTLVVQFNASSLFSTDPSQALTMFSLNSDIETALIDLELSGSTMTFTLSNFPGENLFLNNWGAPAGSQEHLVKNTSQGPEILSFYAFPVDDSALTVFHQGFWSKGLPNENMNAAITENLSLTERLETKNLKVGSGASVTIDGPSSASIVVNGDLNIQGTLRVGDLQSLLIQDENARVDIDGSFVKEEKSATVKSTYDATYWASPVANATSESVFQASGIAQNRVFEYRVNEDNPIYQDAYFKYRHWFILGQDETLSPGRAYSSDAPLNMSYPGDYTLEFEGTPNYKDIDVVIGSRNPILDDVDRTNLLGNPYPSAIDADQLISANVDDFQGTLYFWTHDQTYTQGEYSPSDYLTYNLAGSNDSDISPPFFIGSGQGFMVLTDENTATFKFKNDMQVEAENNVFFKSGLKEKGLAKSKKNDHLLSSDVAEKTKESRKFKVWLSLTDQSGIQSKVLLSFLKEASDSLDVGYDGKLIKAEANIPYLYALAKEEKLSILAKNSKSRFKKLALGLEVSEPGQYTLKVEKIEGFDGQNMILLKDKNVKRLHDLRHGAYSFDIQDELEQNDRFQLRVVRKKFDFPAELNAKTTLAINRGRLTVEAEKRVQKIKIVDLYARKLHVSKPNRRNFSIKLPRNYQRRVLVVQLFLEDGKVEVQKIFQPN